jgi:magnesium-transporting ATPase (P-type)
LYFRNDLSAARVSTPLARRAQLFSQVMFAVAAAGCVLLMRISKQMGGGKLAIAMGWIIAHIVLRAVLVLSSALQAHLHKSLPFSDLLTTLVSTAAIWMFAMAAASRYQVSLTAAQQAARWGVAANGRLVDVAG